MCRYPLAPTVPIARDLRHRLWRQVLELTVGRRWLLERLPQGLLAVPAIRHRADDAERKPADVDPGRVGDVLEQQLREHGADGKCTDQREDGDAVAAELDVEGHPIRPIEIGLDEPQTHNGEMR